MKIALRQVRDRVVATTEKGVSRDGSMLATSVLSRYRSSGRQAYCSFLERFLNFEMQEGEPLWTCLTEPKSAVRKRCLRFARVVLPLQVALTEHGDGSWYFTRSNGPVNYWALAFSVMHRSYEVAAGAEFAMRGGTNPLTTDAWWTWTHEEKMAHCVKVFGPDKARQNFEFGGRMFIRQDAEVYTPSDQDPASLGDRQAAAVKSLLGLHSITCIVLVNRDDGQRWADVNNATFLHWAVCDFDCELWGSNKRGKVDGRGRRKPEKLVAFSPETRDMMIDNVEARHAADPSFPDMTQFRRWRDEGNFAELDKWFVFFKPKTNEPYSYSGYHRLEVKALNKAKVLVYRRGKMRPATSRWARRALHEREWLKIRTSTADKKVIAYLEQQLTDERGHRSHQHHNYASHGKHVLTRQVKNQRLKEQAAARGGKPAPPRIIPGESRAQILRKQARRSPATSKFALARAMRGSQ